VPFKIGVFQELRDNIVSGNPYQAHGWFISRQNPIMSIPDRGKTLEAFGKLDFIVTVHIWCTAINSGLQLQLKQLSNIIALPDYWQDDFCFILFPLCPASLTNF
jgi:hypothetical protein